VPWESGAAHWGCTQNRGGESHADSGGGRGDCGGAGGAAARRLRRGGGLFRDRDDRDEAARLLIEREADKERALQQSEDEAEEAQRALDERERQALQEQDEDAERRKREESEDLQQERRHRPQYLFAKRDEYFSTKGLSNEARDNFREAATIKDAVATQLERDVYNELVKKTGAPPLRENRGLDGGREFYMETEAIETALNDYGYFSREKYKEQENTPGLSSLTAHERLEEARGNAWVEHFIIMQAAFTPEAIAAERSRRNETARAGAAKRQLAAANCYDGPKMLIRPHETMRDFEARCGPRPAAAAPR